MIETIPSFLTNTQVVPDAFSLDGHEATLAGHTFESLARLHGTPLYVLDEATLLNTIQAYQSAYSGYAAPVHFLYACKANTSKGLLKRVVAAGMNLDVVSAGEFSTALAAGVSPSRCMLNGNNKSEAELELAIAEGIGLISVDNPRELSIIDAIARRLGKTVDVILRITPGIECHTHDYIRTGSVDSKFGFHLANVPAAIDQILSDYVNTIQLCGLHAHIGSQIFEVDPYLDLARLMIGLYADIRTRTGHTMTHLDLGGGIGIAYTSSDSPLSLADVGPKVLSAVTEACQQHDYPMPELLLEPGRSIVGRAGMTLYTVGTIKEIPEINKTYVAVDGGMGDNIRPALYQAEYSACVVNRLGEPCTRKVTVAGKYCESGDVILRDLMVPDSIAPGDLLLVFSTGAYNYAMSSQYNRVPRPAMVLAESGGALTPLVRRETLEDLMALDVG